MPLVSICALVSIYSYKLTVSNGGGGHLPLVSLCAMVSIYSYKLTVSNGGGGSFAFGIYMCSGLYIYRLYPNGGGGHLPYKLIHFEWGLIIWIIDEH